MRSGGEYESRFDGDGDGFKELVVRYVEDSSGKYKAIITQIDSGMQGWYPIVLDPQQAANFSPKILEVADSRRPARFQLVGASKTSPVTPVEMTIGAVHDAPGMYGVQAGTLLALQMLFADERQGTLAVADKIHDLRRPEPRRHGEGRRPGELGDGEDLPEGGFARPLLAHVKARLRNPRRAVRREPVAAPDVDGPQAD